MTSLVQGTIEPMAGNADIVNRFEDLIVNRFEDLIVNRFEDQIDNRFEDQAPQKKQQTNAIHTLQDISNPIAEENHHRAPAGRQGYISRTVNEALCQVEQADRVNDRARAALNGLNQVARAVGYSASRTAARAIRIIN